MPEDPMQERQDAAPAPENAVTTAAATTTPADAIAVAPTANADDSPAADSATPVRVAEGWQALPPAATTVGVIAGVLIAAPAALPASFVLAALLDLAPDVGLVLGIVLVVVSGVAGALYARARTRRTRWRLDTRGLQVSRGLVWQGEVLVPRSRVQHLDIERGPIERRFGLATLVVHTAGTRLSALRQSGLADADAVALRDALLPEPGDDDL